MRVVGLHQNRPGYPSWSTMFRKESKDSSALPAYAINLPAYDGTRLASKVTFLIWLLVNWNGFQTSQKTLVIFFNLYSHFLPYGKCKFTFSLVTHQFRATLLMPCLVSAQLPEPNELFNRFPNRYVYETKSILFYIRSCIFYQSFGIE